MLYSELKSHQLKELLFDLQKQGQHAYDTENWPEYKTLMQKWYLAKSYQICHHVQIESGRTYRLAEAYDRLTVKYINGVMVWGTRESDAKEVAVPLAMLELD